MKVKHSKKTKQTQKIIELDNNPVREYLKSQQGKILSVKYLQKNLPVSLKKDKYIIIVLILTLSKEHNRLKLVREKKIEYI